MISRYPLAVAASLVLTAAVGCGGSGDGKGGDETLLPDGERVFEVEGGTLEITSMSLLVKEIVFDTDGPRSISLSEPGTFDIDVMEGTSTPEYPILELEPGEWHDTYLGVEIDDDVAMRSAIELSALYHTDESTTEVLFLFNSNEVFEPRFPTPLVLDEPLSMDIARAFHPSRWFPTIDLREATVGEDGVIVLSETSNTAQFNAVADALDRSTQTVTLETFRE